MNPRFVWFERQMRRLYDARTMAPNSGQIAEYWRAIGARQDAGGTAAFTEAEISCAFDRAIDAVPLRYGLWPVETLLGLCRDERSRQRPSRPPAPQLREPRLPGPPPEVLQGGRQAVLEHYLGPKPEARGNALPRERRTFEPPAPASDLTWHRIGLVARTILETKLPSEPSVQGPPTQSSDHDAN